MEIKKLVTGFEVTVGTDVFAYDTLVEVVAKVNEVFGEAAPETATQPADAAAA